MILEVLKMEEQYEESDDLIERGLNRMLETDEVENNTEEKINEMLGF